MKELVVAAIQVASTIGNAEFNAQHLCGWLDRAAASEARFAFFPECCLTGYSTRQATDIAIAADSEAAEMLERHAADLGMAVGYGLIERDGASDLPFITYVIVSGNRRLVYRKAHLGASERPYFAQGDELPVVDVDGVCVGVQLCWEGHIPDIATTLRVQGAQLIVAPHASGIGGSRRVDSWKRYLPARALDNGLYVMACNALSPERRQEAEAGAHGRRGGGLIAFGPDGALLDSYDGFDEHMICVRIGGVLPRESNDGGMAHISYFDRRRPELYRS